MRILILVCSFLFISLYAEEIRIVSLNTENLFDVEHDSAKNDFNYLPNNHPDKKKGCLENNSGFWKKICLNSDWTKDDYNFKVSQFLKYFSRSNRPDFISLIEVENENVIKFLVKKLGGYDYIMTNSPDKRGIDVALLYKSNKKIIFKGKKELVLQDMIHIGKPSRNILRGQFKIDGKDLFIYVNHWPSQRSKTPTRIIAGKALFSDFKAIVKGGGNTRSIFVGDYNTLKNEKPHPIYSQIDKLDLTDLMKNLNPKLGSYYYAKDKVWNYLDRFIISNSLKKSLISVKVVRDLPEGFKKMKHGQLVPAEFYYNKKSKKVTGFSDHFPIELRLDVALF